ncbi:unnamed protein product [Closterium sp. NIES-53]
MRHSATRRAPRSLVGFLPVVRPGRASIFSPSRAPGVRPFRARRAPRPVALPATARVAPTPPPPPPPFFSIPRLRVQQWGGGYGGGGCGARWFPACRAPCCRPRSSYITPPPSPPSPASPCCACSNGGEGMGVAGVAHS